MRLVALALLLLSAPAAAVDDPSRLVDRVFFSVQGGVGQVSARHVTGPAAEEARGLLSGPAWAAGYSVGLWPWDFLGIDLTFEAMDLSFGPGLGAFGLRLAPTLRLALPLRYVAPYIGAGPALLVPVFSAGTLRGSPGPQFNLRLLAGSSIYVSPELRLFLEFNLVSFDAVAPLSLPKQTSASGTLAIEGGLSGYLTLGLAFTPESFKASASKGVWIAVPIIVALVASGAAVALTLPEAP